MVARRYWSVMSAMAWACALARPNTLRVGRPATTSRKCPASRCRCRACRPIFSLVVWPTKRHEEGDQRHRDGDDHGRDPVGPQGHDDHRDGHDHGQEDLGQVAGEVGVEGVDAAGGEHGQPTRPLTVQSGRAQSGDALHQGLAQLRLGPGRRPVGHPFREPSHQGPPQHGQEEQRHRHLELGHPLVVDEGAGDGRGQQPRLGDDEERGAAPQHDGQDQIATGAVGVAQQPGVDRPGPGPCLWAWRGRRGTRKLHRHDGHARSGWLPVTTASGADTTNPSSGFGFAVVNERHSRGIPAQGHTRPLVPAWWPARDENCITHTE